MGQNVRHTHGEAVTLSTPSWNHAEPIFLKVIDNRWGETFRNGGEKAIRTFLDVYRSYLEGRNPELTDKFVSYVWMSMPENQRYLLKAHPKARYFFISVEDIYKFKMDGWTSLPRWKRVFTARPHETEIDLEAEISALREADMERLVDGFSHAQSREQHHNSGVYK